MTGLEQDEPLAQLGEKDDGTDLHAGYVSVAEITIDAPAKAVWPYVVDMGTWVYDIHFEHISGEVHGEGEVRHLWSFGAEGPDGPITVAPADRTIANATVLKTLNLVPGKLWYGINPPKLEAGVRSTGVNLVLLNEIAGKTLVTAIRSKEAVCPSRDMCKATQAEMLRYQPAAQFRWTDKYLPRLKQLAEQFGKAPNN